jgi:hypothetical protein
MTFDEAVQCIDSFIVRTQEEKSVHPVIIPTYLAEPTGVGRVWIVK